MLYDISPPIDDKIAVWPGDDPPRREVKCHLKDGAPVTLSALHSTVHSGSHADGPNHYHIDGRSVADQPLDLYLGPAQVVSVNNPKLGERFGIDQITRDITAPRVLFKTGTYPDYTNFNTDFAALDPALVDWLHEKGVRLVGMDTPSVDLCDSKDLPAHNAFYRNDMAILEGLILKDVPDGVYELIALPLKLVGYDGSPIRAVLREMK